MSTTQETAARTTELPGPNPLDMRVEVVVVPVTDLERSRRFYESLGWRFDTELVTDDGVRLIQFTPLGSLCSISFGTGITSAEPGSVRSVVLAVHDVEASRNELAARGVDVSEVFHDAGGSLGGGFIADAAARAPGPDPQRRSYASYASFQDPDGNRWLLQEITERLPGRV